MHLHLLLFWNTTDGKGAHCMFKVAAMTFLCIDPPPPPPRCQLLTVIKNLLTQHCRGNLLLRIRLVLVFHRVLQLQRANNIQFREWHFVSVALVWRGIQLWNRTQPNSKNADFFPIQLIIVKIILFRNCMLCQSFTIDYFLIWPKWDKQLRRLNF